MKLTEHFSLAEFTRSATATKYGINNSLDPNNPKDAEIIANLKALCENVLEPLRSYANSITPHKQGEKEGVSIIIGSGYRSPQLNSHPEVRGATTSQHMTGQAADIHIPDTDTGNQWFEWMEDNLQFDQLIKERSTKTSKSFWIHVSFRKDGNNRQQVKYLIKNK